MKVAVICDVLGQANNGTTIAALNLIRTLREKRHEVRVVCPDAERAGEPGYYIVPKIFICSTTMWRKTAWLRPSWTLRFWNPPFTMWT